jgi:hypothetical protein
VTGKSPRKVLKKHTQKKSGSILLLYYKIIIFETAIKSALKDFAKKKNHSHKALFNTKTNCCSYKKTAFFAQREIACKYNYKKVFL